MILVKPVYKILLVILFVIFIAFVAYELGSSLTQSNITYAVLLLLFVGAALYFLSKRRGRQSGMDAAIKYVKQWWPDKFDGEKLSREQITGTEGWFDNETPFYSFKFQRLEGKMAGQWIKIIVKGATGGMAVSHFAESPTVKELGDPFHPLDSEYIFSPVPVKEPIPQYYKWNDQYKYGKAGVAVNIGDTGKKDEFEKMAKGK